MLLGIDIYTIHYELFTTLEGSSPIFTILPLDDRQWERLHCMESEQECTEMKFTLNFLNKAVITRHPYRDG